MFNHPGEQKSEGGGMSGITRIRIVCYVLFFLGIGTLVAYKWWPHPRHVVQPNSEAAPSAPTAPSGGRPPGIEPGDIEFDTRTMMRVEPSDNVPAIAPVTTTAPVHSPVPAPPVYENVTRPAGLAGLEGVKDGAPIESASLYGLLWDVEFQRPADNWQMKKLPAVSVAQLVAHPEEYRGKPVCVRGDLYRLEKSSIESNLSGIRNVMEGELNTDNGMCSFYWTRIPKNGFSLGVDIEVRGIFMKLVKGADESGREVLVPLVIASGPSNPVQGKSSGNSDVTGGLELMIEILVVLVMLYFVMSFFRRRAINRATDARNRARERVERIKEEARADEEAQATSGHENERREP